MGIDTYATDPASGRKAKVLLEHDLFVNVNPSPPLLPQKCRILRQFLTLDGTKTGTFDMQTAASITAPITFFIEADDTRDRYITQLNILIQDASMVLNKFGAITALTNGCRLFYEDTEGDEVDLDNALKSNFDFLRLCSGNPANPDSWISIKVTSGGGSDQGMFMVLDLTKIMPPFGIKLDRGTNQKLVLEVRDDTTGVDGFNVIAMGFERFE